MTSNLKIWLWVSAVLAVSGACMLFPIGPAPANVIFVLIKIGMVSGLLLLVLAQRRIGFPLWAACSGGAVVMTLIKWGLSGQFQLLFPVSMFVDIFMPLYARHLMKTSGWLD